MIDSTEILARLGTALAWLGVIECSTMGSVAGYTRGHFGHPYAPVPATFHLWKPDDEREHEISRLTCSLLRLHKTEDAAKQWTERRAAELRALHDKNHAAQCKDKSCIRRGHTYQPSHDE